MSKKIITFEHIRLLKEYIKQKINKKADNVVVFEEDTSNTEMSSGDNLPVLMGKIKRDIKELKQSGGEVDKSDTLPMITLRSLVSNIGANYIPEWNYTNYYNQYGKVNGNNIGPWTCSHGRLVTRDKSNYLILQSPVTDVVSSASPKPPSDIIPSELLYLHRHASSISFDSVQITAPITITLLLDSNFDNTYYTLKLNGSDTYSLSVAGTQSDPCLVFNFTETPDNIYSIEVICQRFGRFQVGSISEFNLRAIKLESGTQQTLATRIGNENGVYSYAINDPQVGNDLNTFYTYPEGVALYSLKEEGYIPFVNSPKDEYSDLTTTNGTLISTGYSDKYKQVFISPDSGRTFTRHFDQTWSPWVEK